MRRRAFLKAGAGLATGLVSGAALSGCGDDRRGDRLRGRLDDLRRGAVDPALTAPGAALAVLRGDRVELAEAAGTARFQRDGVTPLIPLSPLTHVRAASISKLATALTAQALADQGVFDLDSDISQWLDFDLRHPAHPYRDITARRLLSHTSGLRDPETYWLAAPGRIETLINDELFADYAPGAGFSYCNLGYGVLASALERAGGERFDRLARTYALWPLGLYHTGFNWSGVEAHARWLGATLYRRENGRWAAQADDVDVLESGTSGALLESDFPLDDYTPGDNGTIFTPQGGWRGNIMDMARLAKAFGAGGPGARLAGPVWDRGGPGEIWGAGPQILPAGLTGLDHRLIGHAGRAYGFHGGAWASPEGDFAFAYFVTGVRADIDPVPEAATGFTRFERALFDLALDMLGG